MTDLIINCRDNILNLSSRTHIMGIINCTPDSFYERSRRFSVEEAVEEGVKMVEDGADILDVGGESSRPGSDPVLEAEECERVIPVIADLVKQVDVPISIDTYKSTVTRRALDVGAHIINDISAFAFDENMATLAAEYELPVILMHIKGKPKNMQKNPHYDDVVGEIIDYFQERVSFAVEKGVKKKNIILDPGIGFGKGLNDNYDIINSLGRFAKLSLPILVGPSRKSFIGKVLNLPPSESLEGSLAISTAAILNGAHLLRVHDVKETKRAAQISDHLKNQKLNRKDSE